MHYDIDMLKDDIDNLGDVTMGWRNYTPRLPAGEYAAMPEGTELDPNSPEVAAFEYFLDKYGIVDGHDVAARFFAIHGFVMRNLDKLERRGLLKPAGRSAPLTGELLRFLLTCFDEPEANSAIPRSIYDATGGLALPFDEVMEDFQKLRALRDKLAR
ncbi:MAG: hypothetical protein ACR2M0_03490 [Chloroflexia bacterium]